jgi:hypothetical protein
MRIPWRVAAAIASVASATMILAGCEYAYNDGLPPLGERSSSSANPTPAPRLTRQRFVPPSPLASDPPPEQWSPSMLASWADATLPDANGLTFSFGYGIATPNQPVLATAFVPAGTLILEYVCRGAGSAHLTLTVSGTAIVDSDYACGRIGVRSIVVPENSVAEVRAASVNDPSAYAFRIVRR